MNVSIFKDMTSKLPLPGLLEGVANLVRSDEKIAAFTKSYRQTGSKSFKHECPLFAVAVRFEGGKGKEHIRSLTGLSLVDFDHVFPTDNTDGTDINQALRKMKAKIIADPHTVMCYTTMSGNGLRVIFKYETLPQITQMGTDEVSDENVTYNAVASQQQNPCKSVQSVGENKYPSVGEKECAYYQQAFYTGNAYYERLLGCKADMQCKNLTRLSGLAHDPEVFLRPESEAVPFTAEEISSASTAYAKQSKEDKQLQRIQTYFDTLIAPQLAKANIVFQSGSHNEYVMRVGYRLAERRFPKKTALKWAVERFGRDYPDTGQVINSCFANASPHGKKGGGSGGGNRGDVKTASVEEIKSFLDGHIRLRMNEITSRVEYIIPADKNSLPQIPQINTDFPVTSNGSLTSSYQKDSARSEIREICEIRGQNSLPQIPQINTDRVSCETLPQVWTPVNDRTVNSLWSQMSAVTRVNIQDVYRVIESDYVPLFNPFTEYLKNLCKSVKSVGEKDYIRELAATVRVKGGEQEQILWYLYLKKWLVAMVASWICEDVVNNVILVLIGEQGAFKTTWFNYLLPPELKQYFYTKTNANRMSKDDLLTLAQYALVCCEELDTMRPAELNQLKAVVTMPSIDERAAYAHYHEHRKHIASFCGTGNNTQFLSDPTGNRRWLPFEVESIVSPREHPFHYEGIYSQALALYQSGFQYWFTKEEIQELNRHNRQFETPRLEHELVDLFFRKPLDTELGEFMSVARALQVISNGISQKLSAVNVGRAFVELGFKRVRTPNSRGFIVVCRTAEEIKAFQHRLLADAEYDT